jgi:hypothetical protein
VAVFLHDVAVDGVGIERPVEFAGDVIFYGTKEGTGGIRTVASNRWNMAATCFCLPSSRCENGLFVFGELNRFSACSDIC